MRSARAAAVVTWVYAAAFGLPAVPAGIFLLRNGRLPSFLGLFDIYGGPWSAAFQVDPEEFFRLLLTFLVLMLLVSATGWLVWRGSGDGALLCLMLLPVEAAFWNGFALPVPWLVGTARLVLLALAWRSLTWSNPARRPLVPALEPTRRTPRRSPRR